MTTVFGGEAFRYTDANGNTITAQLNGGVIAELVAATQTGGLASTPQRAIPASADEGVLAFGDIVGTIVSGPRNGTILGNGSVPVTGGGAGSSVVRSTGTTGSLTSGNSLSFYGPASNLSGDTYAIRAFQPVDNTGNVVKSTVQTDSNLTDVQIIKFNNTNGTFDGTATVVLTNTSDSAVPIVIPTTAASVTLTAAAFDPANGILYFEVHEELQFNIVSNNTNNQNTQGSSNTDEIWAYSPASNTLQDIGPLTLPAVGGLPRMAVTGMTFVTNASSPGTATLYVSEQPNQNATAAPTPRPALQPRVNIYETATSGALTAANVAAVGPFVDIYEGFGNQRHQLVNVEGIASIPGSVSGGGGNFLFVVVGSKNNDATTHIVRLDLGSATRDPANGGDLNIEGTDWGNTTDLIESTAPGAIPPFDGQTVLGLTYNPLAINPFTRQFGAFMFIDQNVANNVGTGDLCFANGSLRINTGDVFNVYSTLADINASITFEGSTIYSNQGFLGFNGQLPDNTTNGTFTAGNPILTGELDGTLGILPSQSNDPDSPTNNISNKLIAGLTVGTSLEQVLDPGAALLQQELGGGFDNVRGFAIASDGTISVINSDPFGNGGDELGEVDPATGLELDPTNGNPGGSVPVTLANGTPLNLVEAMAYGGGLTGNEQLYAIYDLGDGKGPTLGTIAISGTSAIFTPIGALKLGADALVTAMAFTHGASPNGTVTGQQGLYVIADPSNVDNDPTETLYRVNFSTGSVLNTPTISATGVVTNPGGIGQVIDASNTNNGSLTVAAISATFDAGDRLVVVDHNTGRLLDVNITTGAAGVNLATDTGTINPTVAGVEYDPDTDSFFAVDNVTGLSSLGNSNSSSLLMTIKDFTQLSGGAVSLGKFFFDGTVTGSVHVSGSMDTFYAGDIAVGDATNGGSWPVPSTFGDGTGLDSAAKEDYFHNNFSFGGDIRNILSLGDAGRITNGSTSTVTNMEVLAGGKVGMVDALGTFAGVVHAEDNSFIPNIPDVSTDGTTGEAQQEIQHYFGDNTDFGASQLQAFANGFLVDANGVAPFGNTTFVTAQYLGSIRNSVSGQPDLIDLQGVLESGAPPTPPPVRINQTVDYFAFSLLAGQTVTVDVTEWLTSNLRGVTPTPLDFGIFDPEGRLIASDFSDVNEAQVNMQPITFTADEPGAYRVAIELAGANATFTGNVAGINAPYELTIQGIGDMAIGAVLASNQILLTGSKWIANSPNNTGSTITNPSIWADRGDVGAVIAGARTVNASNNAQAILSTLNESPNLSSTSQSSALGLASTGDPVGDFTVADGNLRTVIGGQIGLFTYNAVTLAMSSAFSFGDVPDFNVSGAVGLLATPAGDGTVDFSMLSAFFTNPAGGNIQVISSGGDLEGVFRTDQSIGVIRASLVANFFVTNTFETNGVPLLTEFHADVDRTGNDGQIGLIDVTGNWGSTLTIGGLAFIEPGAALVTGPGGDVRFMNVGGDIAQDSVFGGIAAINPVVHVPGPVTFTDDSGAIVTLTPGNAITNNGTNGTITAAGTLTTRTYGVRGAGGVVICDVTSSGGVNVSVNAGGLNRAAEVTNIHVGSPGVPLTIANGVPTLAVSSTSGLTNDVLISSTGNARVDVFDILNDGPNGTGNQLVTIDTIKNTSTGDIVEVTGADVGTISSHGSIGSTIATAGTILNPIAVFNNNYPFSEQHFGVTARNIGVVSADGSVGNIFVDAGTANSFMGIIGTITANANGVRSPNTSAGINGPIVIDGVNANSSANTDVGAASVSLSQLNIGQGILASGSGTMSLAGVFAAGSILQVAGTNADIRGDIVSERHIGTITLNNGSLINAHIQVLAAFNQASIPFFASGLARQYPILSSPNTGIETPAFNIESINIQGNGGIIGSMINAASIGNITVGPQGFGIFSSIIGTPGGVIIGTGIGAINNITAGGYGLAGDTIGDASVNSTSATGNGTALPISNFSTSVRQSEHSDVDPFFGLVPNTLIDLDVFLLSNSLSLTPPGPPPPFDNNALLEFTGPDPNGLTSGVIWMVDAFGQNRLGNVSAFDVVDSQFEFSNATGVVAVRDTIDDTRFVTGKVTSISVVRDAANLEFTAAGSIGQVTIGGNFVVGTNNLLTSVASIVAKGPSGSISNMIVGGNVDGTIQADSNIGTLTIFGNFGNTVGAGQGAIIIGGNSLNSLALGLFKLLGSILGGTINIDGNVGTIDIAHDLANLDQNLVINGNVANLFVGDDPTVNGSVLGAPVTINGNLNNAVITGAMTGTVIIKGNAAKFTIDSDPATAGTNLLTGDLVVNGSLGLVVQGGVTGNVDAGNITSALLSGNVLGNIIGGRGVTSAVITGNLQAGASIGSGLGDVTKLTITGNVDGAITAPNGSLTSVIIGGSVDQGAQVSGNNIGALTVTGHIAGAVSASNTLTALKTASVASTGSITALNLLALTTVGDLLGTMQAGSVATSTKLIVGGNYGASAVFNGPVAATIGGSMLTGSKFSSTNNITSLAVKGGLSGDVLVDKTIGALTAASISNAVITAGMGITSIKIAGGVSDSLVQVGLAAGGDQVFGTGDLGEQARMADLGAMQVGSMTNSIVAAGGNIGTFTSSGAVTGSSISSGMVLSGANIEAVITDASPLATTGQQNAARQNPVLFHGNIKAVAAASFVASSVTAGVSPGPDGAFGTADDNVNTSRTGGNSSISSLKGTPDAASHILANTSGGTPVTYTLDGSSNSIVQNDPVTGAPTAVATPGTPAVIPTAQGTITITVSGDATTFVNVYDNPATTDRVDTLVISSSSSKPVSVVVTTTSPDTFGLGRVLTTDNTQLGVFTFNGDILGDVNGGPSLWIDSDMTTFSVRNMPNDGAWSGQIGGNVKTMSIQQMGPGQLRVGGQVQTLSVASSVGDPFVQQLGKVTPASNLTQMAYDPSSGAVFATDGTHLEQANVNTGAVSLNVPVQSPLSNQTVNLNGLAFDGSGNLFGVATLNNQNPIQRVGQITANGDQLRGMAVNSLGQVFAIDSSSGQDTLVQLDTSSGAETVVGILRDPFTDTYSNNVLAIAFDQNDNLLALLNDRDGNGSAFSTAQGVALAKIATSDPNHTGFVRVSNPNASGAAPIILNGTITSDFTALAVQNSTSSVNGNIYAIRSVGGVEELDSLTLSSTSSTATVTLATVGDVKLDSGTTSTTQVVGMGFDENGNLIALNGNGSSRELISINIANPVQSVRIDTQNLLSTPLTGFAVGKTGTDFTTYGYTTDPVNGGTLFVSPGVQATLVRLNKSGPDEGTFAEMLPLTQDLAGTPLAGTVQSIAIDAFGNAFVITDQGVIAEYSTFDGSLIGSEPIGVVQDSKGATLQVSRIAFDATGELIGLNANANNLVRIDTFSTLQNGQSVALATNLTDIGTADATDLTSLTFSPVLGRFLSYSQSTGDFVSILGTTPDTLGGLVADSFGTINVASNSGGHIVATGSGSGSSIGSIVFTGSGTFTGNITSQGAIGKVSGKGTQMNGTLVTHSDLGALSLTGLIDTNGIISEDGLLKSFVLAGNFNGSLFAARAATVTVSGTVLAGSDIEIGNDTTTFTVGNQVAGSILLGTVKTLKVGGLLADGGRIELLGDAASVTLSAGTDLGSLFLAHRGVSSNLTIGGTLAGTVATRGTVKAASLNNVNGGLLDVGGDLQSLAVKGSVTDSLIATGTWIGDDGVYNTGDDVIFGGSLIKGTISGVFTDSFITAGVLPRIGVSAGNNNIPGDGTPNNVNAFAYLGNPNATDIADVDSAESGGISLSTIQSLTFSKPVVSSFPDAGLLSALVVADGLGNISAKGALQQVVRTDPPGAPQIAIDPTTGLPLVTRFSPSEIRIVFDEPLDSASINSDDLTVDNNSGQTFTNLTFDYFNQTAADGSTQGVIQIISPTNFDNLTTLNINLVGSNTAPTITDRTGLRSALFDYSQDGVRSSDPFGTPVQTQTIQIPVS